MTELHRAVHAVGLFLEARLGGEVSQAEALILLQLRGRSPTTINELHRAFLHRRSTLTSVLDRLESKNLVKRATAATDRRSVSIKLTVRGKRLAGDVSRAFDELALKVEPSGTFGEREVTSLRAIAEEAAAFTLESDR